jgi:hypothetical protein|tara:strand:- start:2728 stop:4263 length:1536 start_codon:yes stop_codon:yes gene_type:complete
MNVLQRRMFAEGDAVNLDIPIGEDIISRTSNLSQLNPQTTSTTRIIQQEGQFFAVKQNRNGDFISSEPIDINLSPTGDPKEAYQRQEQNKMFGSIRNFGTALSLAPTLQTKVGGKIIGGIGNFLNKAFKYSPVKGTKIKGPARTSTGQFRSQSKFDPRSYKYEVQTGPATVIGGAGIAGGAYSATTGYDDVEEEKLEIAEELSALENEPKDQKEIDVETQQDDVNFEIVSTEGETPEGATVVDEEEETSKEAPQVRQQRLLDNPNFSRLIQNIGIGMIETGDIGGGIAQGSAQTSKDIMAFEDAVKEASLQPNEFNKWLTKEEIKNVNKFKEKEADYASALSEAMFEVDTSDAVLKAITDSRKLVATGDATGLIPLLGEYVNEAGRFFGADIELSTREAAKNFINDIINGNIKELTGESGRTISNLDRQIAKNLVGAIEWRSSKENVLDKLGKAYARSKSRYDTGMKNYQARLLPYERRGITPPYQLGISNQDVSSENETQKKRVRLKIIN